MSIVSSNNQNSFIPGRTIENYDEGKRGLEPPKKGGVLEYGWTCFRASFAIVEGLNWGNRFPLLREGGSTGPVFLGLAERLARRGKG